MKIQDDPFFCLYEESVKIAAQGSSYALPVNVVTTFMGKLFDLFTGA